MLFLALYRVFKSMEALSFRSPAETGKVKRFPTLGGLGTHPRFILVLRECIWNAPAVLLVLSTFDDTGSLGFPQRWVVYPPGSTLGDCPLFLCWE